MKGRQPTYQLDDKPVTEHIDGWNGGRSDKETEKNQGVDFCFWIEAGIGTHHAADGAGGTDHRYGAGRIGNYLGCSRGDTTEQIEEQEGDMAHGILDIIAKDPEEPQVADQVKPAAMEKHMSDDGVKAALTLDNANQCFTHRDLNTGRQQAKHLAGDQSKMAKRSGKGAGLAHSLNKNPGSTAKNNNGNGYDGKSG